MSRIQWVSSDALARNSPVSYHWQAMTDGGYYATPSRTVCGIYLCRMIPVHEVHARSVGRPCTKCMKFSRP